MKLFIIRDRSQAEKAKQNSKPGTCKKTSKKPTILRIYEEKIHQTSIEGTAIE